ncbi:hypothetical protein GF362_04980 [Candidatus Dojkabacteria bacterium]|nr:hypothetical protein [Candidatus Dojkabacteria bacterium]
MESILKIINIDKLLEKYKFLKIAFCSLLLLPFILGLYILTQTATVAESSNTIKLEKYGKSYIPQTVGGAYTLSTGETTGMTFDEETGELKEVEVERCQGYMCQTINGLDDLTSGGQYVEIDPDTGEVVSFYEEPGAMQTVIATAGNFYDPPVQPATDWVMAEYETIKSRLSPVQEVQAQEKSTVYFPGLGYNILQPIRTFWSMNRNIAYGFEIIIIFVIAFLMLFRQKLGGQEVVSLLNSIPSIILSLILITFSYPLSGLFIDVITVGANLVQSILVSSPGAPGYNTVWNGELVYSTFDKDSQMTVYLRTAHNKAIDILPGGDDVPELDIKEAKTGLQIDDPLVSVWLVFGTANLDVEPADLEDNAIFPSSSVLIARSPIGGVVNSLKDFLVDSDAASTLASGLLTIIFSFAAFMASIKIFFSLLKSWATLIIYPIVSPFLFLIAAIPSQTAKIIQSYIKTMLSASLSFVAVYAVFLFIIVISNEPLIHTFKFTPPLLGYTGVDDAGVGAGGQIVRTLLGFGLFMATPMIPDGIKQLIEQGTTDLFGKKTAEAGTQGASSAAMQLLGLAQNFINRRKQETYRS